MSFKMHNGHRVRGVTTLDEAYRLIISHRREIEGVARNIEHSSITNKVVSKIDLAYVFPETYTVNGAAVVQAYDDLMENRKKYSYLSIDSELILIPFENEVLAIPFGNSILCRDIAEIPVLEYYGYWDNTDPDPDVPTAEWEERARKWQTIFEKNEPPSKVGVSVQMSTDNLPWMDSEELQIMAASIPIIKRADKLARQQLLEMRLKVVSDSSKPIHQFVSEASRWIDKEGSGDLIRLKDKVIPMLPDFNQTPISEILYRK